MPWWWREPLEMKGGGVGTGEVGDDGAGGAGHVRGEAQLLAGRPLVLPGERFQPDSVVGEGFW